MISKYEQIYQQHSNTHIGGQIEMPSKGRLETSRKTQRSFVCNRRKREKCVHDKYFMTFITKRLHGHILFCLDKACLQ